MAIQIRYKKLSLLGALILLSPVAAFAQQDDTLRSVKHINWHSQVAVDAQNLLAKPIPQNRVSLFFIRQADTDGAQTSANLAINGQYQTSLQPAGYTQVYSCAGVNNISVVTTSKKTNDLLKNAIEVLIQHGHLTRYIANQPN